MTTIPSTTHDLKTWPNYFEQTWLGWKPFDIRYDDRGYQRGDVVRLREWDRKVSCDELFECVGGKHNPETCPRYSGRIITATVGYVLASAPGPSSRRAFNGDGYVVLGLVDVSRIDGRRVPAAAPPLATPATVAKTARS